MPEGRIESKREYGQKKKKKLLWAWHLSRRIFKFPILALHKYKIIHIHPRREFGINTPLGSKNNVFYCNNKINTHDSTQHSLTLTFLGDAAWTLPHLLYHAITQACEINFWSPCTVEWVKRRLVHISTNFLIHFSIKKKKKKFDKLHLPSKIIGYTQQILHFKNDKFTFKLANCTNNSLSSTKSLHLWQQWPPS